jgi:Ca-activated chloride channel family protein
VTIDHNVLINQIKNLKTGLFQDGTAIGSGLATAVSRLKDSKAKSKVIILLTDGKNNSGVVSPETGSDIAKTFGIRVYTIAVGKYGQAMMPFMTPNGKQYQQVEVDIDEDVLKNIANITKGEFFRATDNKSLSVIYSRIDKLEKSKIEVSYYNRKTEEYLPFLVIAASLLLLEYMMRLLIYRFSI